MVFTAPAWVPQMPPLPDVPLCEFLFDEQYGRAPIATSLPPYVCGITGRAVTVQEQKEKIQVLARGLADELGWKVNEGTEFDKIVCIFALNTVDISTLTWAVHRINGATQPVSAIFNEKELAEQLRNSKAKVIFTVLPLLETSLKAAKMCSIPEKRVYICDMPGDGPSPLITLSQLLARGGSLPPLEPMKWSPGQSKRQVAIISHSSGTSGVPKLVPITHFNVLANVVQLTLYEAKGRGKPSYRDVLLGALPLSHIYGVVVISHLSMYRGDSIIVLPRFDMEQVLSCTQKFRINTLCLVPPIIVNMIKQPDLLARYDLTSVTTVISGAGPLGPETVKGLAKYYPTWVLRQAYGLTESAACICHTSAHDPWIGSSGSILPGVQVKLLDQNGDEITACDKPGELLCKSPSIVSGYLHNETATQETFMNAEDGHWLRTGDVGLFSKAPSGNEHVLIVDRVKDLIKVKGYQVAPAELEACLLSHPLVADCAVIPVDDEVAGEVPKAYIQRAINARLDPGNHVLAEELYEHVKRQKSRPKWLKGGIAFVDAIPKSPSGKILRRFLRDKERELKRKLGPSL